jgi:HK97 family phage major capsid protein
MEAFRHYLKTGEVIKAVINEGTTNEGGVAVPKELIPTIIGRRDEMSLLGQFNFRRFTTSVRQVDVPVQDAKADFAVVAESGAANQDEPDFANSRTITVYRYNMLMKVTNEFLADQQANFDQFITEEIARAYARLVNNYIINGTGSGQPYGILARATTSETLAAVAGLDFADVLNIMHKLPSAYDEAGSTGWVMRNATLGAIRALTGDYPQFRPMVNGTSKDLEGYPVALSDKIAALGASAKPIIFGNMNEYAFVENATIEVVRNPYLYMANNQTGIFVNVRWGGDVLQPEAFVYGVNPAS